MEKEIVLLEKGMLPSQSIFRHRRTRLRLLQCVSFGGRRIRVFRAAGRDSDLAGFDQMRSGQGTCSGLAFGGPGAVVAQYAGDQECHWHEKDPGLRGFGGCGCNNHRTHLWFLVLT